MVDMNTLLVVSGKQFKNLHKIFYYLSCYVYAGMHSLRK